MIHFVVPADQDFGFADYLAVNGGDLQQRCEIIHYESLPERSRFRTGTYVFSALDQLTPAMRALAAELHATLGGVLETRSAQRSAADAAAVRAAHDIEESQA